MTEPAYYNEIDLFAAKWLRNLIDAGHIAPGVVDTRSIEDVTPNDLKGFKQCHFFAGIGVWSHALRRAGWPDDRPVWTGSCPCQPFSTAGKGAGFADERHLWPSWHHLIEICRPPRIYGEQVASSDAMPWLDLVQDDLEILGYAFGAVPFPSASVGAPHIRDRLYWMADADNTRSQGWSVRGLRRAAECAAGSGGVVGGLGHPDSERARRFSTTICEQETGEGRRGRGDDAGAPGPTRGFWADADWIPCRDDKARPVEPGTFPLAHGATSRVGRLRAYGNAINAEQAVAFVIATELA